MAFVSESPRFPPPPPLLPPAPPAPELLVTPGTLIPLQGCSQNLGSSLSSSARHPPFLSSCPRFVSESGPVQPSATPGVLVPGVALRDYVRQTPCFSSSLPRLPQYSYQGYEGGDGFVGVGSKKHHIKQHSPHKKIPKKIHKKNNGIEKFQWVVKAGEDKGICEEAGDEESTTYESGIGANNHVMLEGLI